MASTQDNAVDERTALIERLESSEERFLKSVAHVNDRAAKVKPNPNSWSVLEVAEHVAIIEAYGLQALKNAPANDAPPNYEMDAKIQEAGLDRMQKLNAPVSMQPKGQYPSLAHTVAAFRKARKETIEYVRTCSDNLRKRKLKHPFGEVDGHQFALLLAIHPERHAQQIEEVKDLPAFLAAK